MKAESGWHQVETAEDPQNMNKFAARLLDTVKRTASSGYSWVDYRVVPAHRNWQIETAVWKWAGFFTVGLETRWQQFGQVLDDL